MNRLPFSKIWAWPLMAGLVAPLVSQSADLTITGLDRSGHLSWADASTTSVLTVQRADVVDGNWANGLSVFATTAVGRVSVTMDGDQGYLRLLSVDVSGTPEGHTNMLQSFGLLEPVAGTGFNDDDKINNWRPEFEWGPAVDAHLSRPHIAFAQPDNNLLLVDEGSSSILRITTNGLIHTFAGTHVNGFNGDGPDFATNLHLHWPNGGYMAENGTFYVMDTYNSRIRRIDTNGIMTTMFAQPQPTQFDREGRGLWVNSDETEVWFTAGTTLERWTPTNGVEVIRDDFLDLGNMVGDEDRDILILSDRDQQSIFEFGMTSGDLTRIAGNGTQSGGGDGFPALQTGLARPRTVAFFPNGGYLIGEHSPGYRVWYVDPAGIIHLWMAGANNAHTGDDEWFYNDFGTAKNGKIRAITIDREGNVILVANDHGFVRRVRFQRLFP